VRLVRSVGDYSGVPGLEGRWCTSLRQAYAGRVGTSTPAVPESACLDAPPDVNPVGMRVPGRAVFAVDLGPLVRAAAAYGEVSASWLLNLLLETVGLEPHYVELVPVLSGDGGAAAAAGQVAVELELGHVYVAYRPPTDDTWTPGVTGALSCACRHAVAAVARTIPRWQQGVAGMVWTEDALVPLFVWRGPKSVRSLDTLVSDTAALFRGLGDDPRFARSDSDHLHELAGGVEKVTGGWGCKDLTPQQAALQMQSYLMHCAAHMAPTYRACGVYGGSALFTLPVDLGLSLAPEPTDADLELAIADALDPAFMATIGCN
jgi:hypothetical protein